MCVASLAYFEALNNKEGSIQRVLLCLLTFEALNDKEEHFPMHATLLAYVEEMGKDGEGFVMATGNRVQKCGKGYPSLSQTLVSLIHSRGTPSTITTS